MKILFVTPHLSTGGLPQYLLFKIKNLMATGHKVGVVEWNDYGRYFPVQRKAIMATGCMFYTCPNTTESKIECFKDAIAVFKPDIIHFEELPETFCDYPVLKSIFNSHIITVCSTHGSIKQDIKYIPDLFIWPSEHCIKMYPQFPNFKVWEYPIIPNVLPDEKRTDVTQIGLWSAHKNQGYTLEMAAAMPETRFHFIGNTADNFKPYWDELVDRAKNMGNVIVHGELGPDGINAILEKTKVLIMPSTKELNPISVKEALSHNCEVLISDIGNLPSWYRTSNKISFLKNNAMVVNGDVIKLRELINKEESKTEVPFKFINAEDIYLSAKKVEDKLSPPPPTLSGKSACIVVAHADTDYRKSLLKSCIKSLPGDIILVSNHPLDDETKAMCKHVIETDDNPLLLESEFDSYGVEFKFWRKDKSSRIIEYRPEYDHGYAAYTLIQKGVEFAKRIGKEIVHIINYDYEIPLNVLIENELCILAGKDAVLYRHDPKKKQYDEDSFCTGFFSTSISFASEFCSLFNSKKEYYTSGGSYKILEIKMDDFSKGKQVEEKYLPDLERVGRVNQEGVLRFSKTFIHFDAYYLDRPSVVISNNPRSCYVSFIDSSTDRILHHHHIPAGGGSCTVNYNYFIPWRVEVFMDGKIIHTDTLDLKDQRVFVAIESSSLGDTLAWMPVVDQFQKKHNCKLILSTHLNHIFDKREYPNIEFVEPSAVVTNLYAHYKLGLFDKDNRMIHPTHPLLIPLQRIAADRLGIKYTTAIRPHTCIKSNGRESDKIVVCGESTAAAKEWNRPGAITEFIKTMIDQGYRVTVVQKGEPRFEVPKGAAKMIGQDLRLAMIEISRASVFVGLPSGLSWLAWALETPVVMVSGFSAPYSEFEEHVRVQDFSVCNSCWNDPELNFDKGDWAWCPRWKGTEHHFECTKSITSEHVVKAVKSILPS